MSVVSRDGKSPGGCIMDYRQEIKTMIDSMENQSLLRKIYLFVRVLSSAK